MSDSTTNPLAVLMPLVGEVVGGRWNAGRASNRQLSNQKQTLKKENQGFNARGSCGGIMEHDWFSLAGRSSDRRLHLCDWVSNTGSEICRLALRF